MATYKMIKKDDKYYCFLGALKEFAICCTDVYNVIWSLTNIKFYDKDGKAMVIGGWSIKDTYHASFTLNGTKVDLEVRGTYYVDQYATYNLSYFLSSSDYHCCMLNQYGDNYGFFFTCEKPIRIGRIEFSNHLTTDTCCVKSAEIRFKGACISRTFTAAKKTALKVSLKLFDTPNSIEEMS